MIEFQAAFVAVVCLHHRHVYLLLMGKVLALKSVGVWKMGIFTGSRKVQMQLRGPSFMLLFIHVWNGNSPKNFSDRSVR